MFKRTYKPTPFEITIQMREWKKEEGLKFNILYRYRKGILEIFTKEPGIIIGFRGQRIDRLNEKLKSVKGFKKCIITYIRDYV